MYVFFSISPVLFLRVTSSSNASANGIRDTEKMLSQISRMDPVLFPHIYSISDFSSLKLLKKNRVCLRPHGRTENYEITWSTDFKTLRRFFSRNLLERSFAIALFRSALFSLTCLFCITSVGSSCIEEFTCWDSVHFVLRYFFTRALVDSLFILNLALIWFFHISSVTEDN